MNNFNRELDVEFQTHSNDIIDKGRELYIKGLASTNSTDINQDIVTPQALQSMLGWIKQAKVNFHADHIHKIGGLAGSVVQAELIGNELWITARILPKHRETIRELLEFGISLGLSVGGKAVRSPHNPHLIVDYKLMEITLTPIPALLESKGTVKEVEAPTCISSACYLAIKADEQNNRTNNQNKNKMYEEINMMTKTASIAELDYYTQRIDEMIAQIDYNNEYGFDNKAYDIESDDLMQELGFDTNMLNMFADVTPEDVKMANDFVQALNYEGYQDLIQEADLNDVAVAKGLDYKFYWGALGDLALSALDLLPRIYTGVRAGKGLWDMVKEEWDKFRQPKTVMPSTKTVMPSNQDYYPDDYYPDDYYPDDYYPPKPQVPTPVAPNYSTPMPNASYLDRLRKGRFDTKAFEYVGEPMPSNSLPEEENDFMSRIERMIMEMIEEAFMQKTPVIAHMVKDQLQNEMQGVGGMQQNGPTMPPQMPPEPPAEEDMPLTPEEKAAAEEEAFEEEAARKKSKKRKKGKKEEEEEEEEDLKSYVPITYPPSFIDPEPVFIDSNGVEVSKQELDTKTAELNRIKSRTSVPESVASKMEALNNKQPEKVGCGGLTKKRDEMGRFIG